MAEARDLNEELIEKYNEDIPVSFYDVTKPEKEQNQIFNSMRDRMKKVGKMFLFGKPTDNIVNILIKIYHENIVRLLKLKGRKIPQFMTGILELENGQIFITISEDPDEDSEYKDKLNHIYSILKQTNIAVDFEKGMPRTSLIEWRNPLSYKEPLSKVDFIAMKDLMFTDEYPEGKRVFNYSEKIWEKEYNVTLIDSINYLTKRKEGVSFMPFKKYSEQKTKDSKTQLPYVECNNGSTCAEAKLFSYVYDQGFKFNQIRGFAAYWVGNNLPPEKHIIPNYCYSTSKPDELKKLRKLVAECYDILNAKDKELMSSYKNTDIVLINSIQPLALACPGCVLNWVPYTNDIRSKWDYGQCYQEHWLRHSRTSIVGAEKMSGGRYTNKHTTIYMCRDRLNKIRCHCHLKQKKSKKQKSKKQKSKTKKRNRR